MTANYASVDIRQLIQSICTWMIYSAPQDIEDRRQLLTAKSFCTITIPTMVLQNNSHLFLKYYNSFLTHYRTKHFNPNWYLPDY